MNFDFSDDQKMLRDQVRKFLTDKCAMTVTREVLEGDLPHAEEVWDGLVELGLVGAAIAEEYGGAGLGALELCVVAEELGRACAPVPFATTVYLAADAITRFGSDAQKQEWLPRIATGMVATLAVSEGAQSVGAGSVGCRFENGALNGDKWPVLDGQSAELVVVLAKTNEEKNGKEGGLSMVLVDLSGSGSGSGITRESVPTIDPARKAARLGFDGAVAELVGVQGQGWQQLQALYDRAAVLVAFEQVGGAEAAMLMTRDYTLERFAFGRQIGSFQAIKHKLADMYVKLELARSNAYYGAMMLDDDDEDLPIAAAAARVGATEAYAFAATESIQIHGGIGYTWEADTQFHYRRARLLALMLGGPLGWKDRLVSRLEEKNAA